jgi:hypothetical protein
MTSENIPEMVERVAIAIWSVYGSAPALGWEHAKKATGNDLVVRVHLERVYRMARNAIKAMREPTEGMLDIVQPPLQDSSGEWRELARRDWRKLIDAALEL